MLNSSLNDLNYDTSFATGNLSTLDDHDRSINIQQQLHWAAAVLQLIQLYYTPVLVILGSIGNIISVFVFFNTKLRKQSSSYYLAALAISDTGFLITQFISWLNLVDLPLFKKSGYCQMTIYTSHKKVKDCLTMTGEITLRSEVLPVGGINEKILAAKRVGMKEIILSSKNKKDVQAIKAIYRENLIFHYVDSVDQVYQLALQENKIANAKFWDGNLAEAITGQ
ncbi:hypothetical protein PGB90_000580 [Kerria lacca]